MKRHAITILTLTASVLLGSCSYVELAPDESGPATEITSEETSSETSSKTDEETVSDETTTEATAEETTTEAATEETTEEATEETSEETTTEGTAKLDFDGSYTTVEDVSLFIYTYGELPSNFITKKEARALGWEGGSLEPYAPGKCIGGDYFGNYEGLLPEQKGREYHECDIDTLGAKSRGAKRIIYSNDGLIYYTADHYESFELLYGKE